MKRKEILKRILTSFTVVMLAVTMIFSSSISVVAESQSSLEDKIAAAKKKAAALSSQAASANETYQAKLDVYYAASDAVDTINGQISTLEKRISATEASISKLNKQIKKQEDDIKQKYEAFKARIKALYISGNLTNVQVLLTSEDFSDYLTKLEMVQQVSKRDNASIDEMEKMAQQLEKAQKKLDADKDKLESQKVGLEKDKTSLVKAKSEAEKAYNESLTILRQIKSKQANNNSQLAEYKHELNDVLEQIRKAEEAAKKQNSSGSSGSSGSTIHITQGTGQFCYPVPGHTHITCGFYGYSNHNGVDFSDGSIYGATVVAADSGTVVRVKYLTYSYGYHIYIYHGNGLTTQYCHLSAIYVNEGQSVSKGQRIGAVGSTGNSTGAHLHFGIFNSSGSFLNPENYF